MKRKNEKDHYARKNAGSATLFRKQRKANNALRAKQRWVGGSVSEGGHWVRGTEE